ncbi:MAG TPA: TetR family transcriptional regulator [Anaerolineaceae bacterium]
MLASHDDTRRVDPRVKRTRKLINQAFVDLMNEKGFQAITVQDIADRAEVNRATFYAHYEDKYDLLDRYVREGFRDWLSQKVSPQEGFRLDLLARLVAGVFEFSAEMNDHCGRLDKQLEPMLALAMQEELAAFLQEWFRQPYGDAPALRQPEEAVAMIWSWAILGAGMQWSRGGKELSAKEAAGQVVEVLLRPLEGGPEFPGRRPLLLNG